MQIEDDVKDRIEQIDSEEFKIVVKQLKLGNTELADKFMEGMKMGCISASTLNIGRMGFITAFVLLNPSKFKLDKLDAGKFEMAAMCLLLTLAHIIGLDED